MADKNSIRHRALVLISEGGRNTASLLGREFGLSRQAANNHLKALRDEGLIEAEGSTRGRVYRLVPLRSDHRTYRSGGLAEDEVWRQVFLPAVRDLPENVVDIWRYGVTEMVNNAVEHSESPTVEVGVRRDAVRTFGTVRDYGTGIFLKIQRAFGFPDPRQSILELAKGKLTTDPASHTGEGIFFASRVFDSFLILSGKLSFFHDRFPMDLLTEKNEEASGTSVNMWLANESSRTLKSVFEEFSSPETYRFDRTIVPVRLAQYEGEKLVSRSQARRLTERFDRFLRVILDFSEVVEIGQAFADELFRVYARAHPQVELKAENMTRDVERMIQRVRYEPEEPAK